MIHKSKKMYLLEKFYKQVVLCFFCGVVALLGCVPKRSSSDGRGQVTVQPNPPQPPNGVANVIDKKTDLNGAVSAFYRDQNDRNASLVQVRYDSSAELIFVLDGTGEIRIHDFYSKERVYKLRLQAYPVWAKATVASSVEGLELWPNQKKLLFYYSNGWMGILDYGNPIYERWKVVFFSLNMKRIDELKISRDTEKLLLYEKGENGQVRICELSKLEKWAQNQQMHTKSDLPRGGFNEFIFGVQHLAQIRDVFEQFNVLDLQAVTWTKTGSRLLVFHGKQEAGLEEYDLQGTRAGDFICKDSISHYAQFDESEKKSEYLKYLQVRRIIGLPISDIAILWFMNGDVRFCDVNTKKMMPIDSIHSPKAQGIFAMAPDRFIISEDVNITEGRVLSMRILSQGNGSYSLQNVKPEEDPNWSQLKGGHITDIYNDKTLPGTFYSMSYGDFYYFHRGSNKDPKIATMNKEVLRLALAENLVFSVSYKGPILRVESLRRLTDGQFKKFSGFEGQILGKKMLSSPQNNKLLVCGMRENEKVKEWNLKNYTFRELPLSCGEIKEDIIGVSPKGSRLIFVDNHDKVWQIDMPQVFKKAAARKEVSMNALDGGVPNIKKVLVGNTKAAFLVKGKNTGAVMQSAGKGLFYILEKDWELERWQYSEDETRALLKVKQPNSNDALFLVDFTKKITTENVEQIYGNPSPIKGEGFLQGNQIFILSGLYLMSLDKEGLYKHSVGSPVEKEHILAVPIKKNSSLLAVLNKDGEIEAYRLSWNDWEKQGVFPSSLEEMKAPIQMVSGPDGKSLFLMHGVSRTASYKRVEIPAKYFKAQKTVTIKRQRAKVS